MKEKLGMALLLVAGAVIFVMAGNFTITGNLLVAVAVLALAAGALLSGTAGQEGRPV